MSGPGSTIAACATIIERMPFWLELHSIKSIVDLGCGDFNWMSRIDLGDIEYDGYDIVSDVIRTALNHTASNIAFHHADILEMKIPKADLVICKDVLIHLPNDEALKLLQAIQSSGSRLLATTTCPAWDNRFRAGMNAGEFSPINLEGEPFFWSPPEDAIEVPHGKGNPKKFFALFGMIPAYGGP